MATFLLRAGWQRRTVRIVTHFSWPEANVPDAPDGRRTLRALPRACDSIPGLGGERTPPRGSRRLDRYGIAIRSAGRRTHGQNRSGPSGEAGLSSPIASRFSRGATLARRPPRLRAKLSSPSPGLTRDRGERDRVRAWCGPGVAL